MMILDARSGQQLSQRTLIELRMTARAGITPHVGDRLDIVEAKHAGEFRAAPRRMTNCPNSQSLPCHVLGFSLPLRFERRTEVPSPLPALNAFGCAVGFVRPVVGFGAAPNALVSSHGFL